MLRIGSQSEIWLHEGAVYLARTPSSADVSSVLFGVGTATEASIIELLGQPDGNAAATLVGDDPEAAATLDRLLHEYNLSALFEMVVPTDATFNFEAGTRHPIGPRFAESVADLIEQANRRLEIWTQIAARIPSTSAVFSLQPALPDGAEERIVTGDEWRYLSLLDGHTSVADVINQTGESAFRVCSSLYRLLLEGLIAEV